MTETKHSASPQRLVYQAGFGEAYPFNDRRGPFEIEDPDMPGATVVVGGEPQPAGFGTYESGEQFAWPQLKHLPEEFSYEGQNGGVYEDPAVTLASTPWFGQGYEPPWSANDPGGGYGSSGDAGLAYDEYGDPLPDLFTLPDLEDGMGEDWNVGLSYSVTASVLAITVCDREEEQQSKQQVEMTTSFILRGERVYLFQPQTVSDSAGLLHPRMFPVRPAAADRRLRTDSD
ncbi:hypothetical protein GC176_03090 [bacterium]|nr:hypothetical protein [bacterium]